MGTYELIKQAILGRKQVHADYKGYQRQLCPHVIGWKDGKAQALFYQFGGRSSSGLAPDGSGDNWRCLFLDELSNVTIHDGDWHTAPNHTRRQTCVDEIDVEIT